MDRYQETKIQETKNEDGVVVERVTEEWVEKIPLEIKQKVVEKIVPIIMERRTESYKDGEIVDTTVEMVEGMNMVGNVKNNFVDIEPDPVVVAPVSVRSDFDDIFYTVAYSAIVLEILWIGYMIVVKFL